MKLFRQINRLLRSYVNVKRLGLSLKATPWYLDQLLCYRSMTHEQVPLSELYPALQDRFGPASRFDRHYFRQDLWVAGRIISAKPSLHVDIGSRFDGFAAQLSLIVPVEMVDIRPLNHGLATVRFRHGNICSLPYPNHSLTSVSSLHVVEHIGLGRYGDSLDPRGPEKALKELQRVLARGGVLYLSIPIGRPRVCFNSHRVFDPDFVIFQLNELTLSEFRGIDDDGAFLERIAPAALRKSDYALGIYEFYRPKV